jgi:hypothetical protein
MTVHVGETLVGETEDRKLTMRLEKKRRRLEGEVDAKWRSRFVVLEEIPAPEDPPALTSNAPE